MRILSTQEINMVSGANSNPYFDLTLATQEGALCGIVFGVPIALLLGYGIISSINEAANASYHTAIAATLGISVLFIASGVLLNTTLAYFNVPFDYIFY